MFGFKFWKKIFRSETYVIDNTANDESMSEEYYDVFISKKTEDSEMAEEVCAFLESNGLKCFVSERDLPNNGNVNYYQVIDKALENSTNLVLVCSRAEYLETRWVQHEWQAFCNELLSSHGRSGNIITIRGEQVQRNDIPYTLRNLQLIEWRDYKNLLLSYIVKKDLSLNDIKNIKDHSRSMVASYSDAFMLGLQFGNFGLASVGGSATLNDVNRMKKLLSDWDIPDDEVEPLLQLGKGMDFLNSIIDTIGKRWGIVYENSAYLGAVYLFCTLSRQNGSTAWDDRIVKICKDLGVPFHIIQKISNLDAQEMVDYRDILMKVLDNLDDTVTKCPSCNARMGFDYEQCPVCNYSVK